jgi:phage shock protein PspC (stress-responsive transcriptional regulator)
MGETKSCPYCAEEIRAEATRCRFCRSRLVTWDVDRWQRRQPDAKLAGVCAALARVFVVPVAAIRLGFVVLTFFHFLGPLLYGALWLLIPGEPGGVSLLERVLQRALAVAGAASGRRNDPPATRASGPSA